MGVVEWLRRLGSRRLAGAVGGLVAAVALVVAVAVWLRPAPDRPEVAAAERVAAALRTGEVAPDAFDAPDAAARLSAARRGLDPLRPEVRVTSVVADADSGAGSAVLEQRWIIHAGKAPWSYRTTVPLRRTADGWRGLWSSRVVHPDLAEGEALRATRLPARRGEVIGADGVRLAFRQTIRRVGIDLTLVDRTTAQASAARLATILAIDPAPLRARVDAASDKAFVEAASLRTFDAEQRWRLERAEEVPGVRTLLDERMLARSPTFARPFLGIVGEATADAVAASDGEVRPGDLVGLGGLQAAQDRRLRGSSGFVVRAGERELSRLLPADGEAVHVALDADLQERADTVVADAVAGGRAAIVVLRPSDGHVLAVASAGGTGSLATQGRVALGPAPVGLADAVAPLRWGTSGQLGVPAFLGEVSDQAYASPLGLAEAAASAAVGETVVPVVVTDDGEPARPGLDASRRAALAALVARADATTQWAIRTTDDRVVVAWSDRADAAAWLGRI